MSYDYYFESRKLATMLKQANLNDFSEKIIKSIEEGCTGTEILMALRWNLNELLTSPRCSEAIKSIAQILYNELDKALNDS